MKKIIVDDVEVYESNSKKWENSIAISRPSETGRYINIPKTHVPKLLEALNLVTCQEFSFKFVSKTGKDLVVSSESFEELVLKEGFETGVPEGQMSLKEILEKKKVSR